MSTPALEESGRREEFLAAARTIFAHYGFRRASLEEIAREAGVSRTALYHHFRNKEDIFRAMCEAIYARATERAEAASEVDEPVDAKLLNVLDAQVGWVFRLLARSRHGLEIVDEADQNADMQQLARRRWEERAARLGLVPAPIEASGDTAPDGDSRAGGAGRDPQSDA